MRHNGKERTYNELKELIESQQKMDPGIPFDLKLNLIQKIKLMNDEAVIDMVRIGIAELGHRLAGVYEGTDHEEAKIDLAIKGMQDCVDMLRVSVTD